jgi:uncharacterized membrane protein
MVYRLAPGGYACCMIVAVLAMSSMGKAAYAQNVTTESIEIDFFIKSDDSVVQTSRFNFANNATEDYLTYNLSHSVRDVSIYDDTEKLEYNLSRTDGTYVLRIFLKKPTGSLTLNYTSDSLVFRGSDDVRNFFTEFSFDHGIKNMSVSVALPPGFSVYRDSYQPVGAAIGSDGRTITLNWNASNATDSMFSVKFFRDEQPASLLPAAIGTALAAIIILYIYFRRRERSAFVTGFREDELKTVQFIEAKGTALQRDLQKEFGFSRAKATRIVANLEKMGLVRKQKYGRTNKLFWVKREETVQPGKIAKRMNVALSFSAVKIDEARASIKKLVARVRKEAASSASRVRSKLHR